MKQDKNNAKKDTDGLKQGIKDMASTSKEIARDKFHDAKTEAQSTADTVVEKTQTAASGIKTGSIDVAKNVKKTAVKVARTVSASNKRDK